MHVRVSSVRYLALGIAVALIGCRPASEQPTQPESGAAEGTVSAGGTAGTVRADELTCSHPVTADDTPASLKQRFGDAARVETIYGPEGIELSGVALWPDDSERRVEVVFSDEGERLLSFAGVSGDKSAWRLAGLALGDPLASAQRANGGPFELWGFSWDYGGYASDLRGGRLAALPGGCRAIVRFDLPEHSNPPGEVLGEVRLASDDPLLAGAEPPDRRACADFRPRVRSRKMRRAAPALPKRPFAWSAVVSTAHGAFIGKGNDYR